MLVLDHEPAGMLLEEEPGLPEFAKERGTLDKQRDREAQRAGELQEALTSINSELAKASTQLAGEREAHHSTKAQLKGVVKDLEGRTRERDRQAASIRQLTAAFKRVQGRTWKAD